MLILAVLVILMKPIGPGETLPSLMGVTLKKLNSWSMQ